MLVTNVISFIDQTDIKYCFIYLVKPDYSDIVPSDYIKCLREISPSTGDWWNEYGLLLVPDTSKSF